MLRFAKLAVVPAILLAAACDNSGAGYTPIVDGPVGPNYAADLSQCQALASSQNITSGGARNVATGAGVAAAGTAIFNNTGNNVRDAAAVGALAGIAATALDSSQQREVIIRNCMRGRGYNVLG
ncbi:glycine zipper family protein [Chachezhania antarctica]|uniref:glycine zipper family protein n=1 Tax=Chachezhania antarctica TaxID=2340860 RepID=UPI000EB04174|nr:glycine zipper family protein [Chachezhania antarctica]